MTYQNLVFKCTYNNGNAGHYVGYNGCCSEDIIKHNIESGRVWCSQNDCQCYKYYQRGFKGKKPDSSCMESELFKQWGFGAGMYHHGERAGTEISFSRVEKSKIAFLTTRYPGDTEIERKIFGLFKIAAVTEDKTFIYADKKYRVPIPKEEADNLFFWDYHNTKGGAKWGTGLFRYISDEATINILSDLFHTIRDEKVKHPLLALLADSFGVNIVPDPVRSGPHARITGDRLKKVAIARKYGSTGEGREHKNLKNYVAKHPNILGLSNVTKTHVEYLFPSGDLVDIMFETKAGRDIVVEIETNVPFPGCYQAIKYRSLRCAEKMLDLQSTSVRAVVVAWDFAIRERDFCQKYDIDLKKIKLKQQQDES